ncbi:MAG TPA: alkaline phosphatase family protein [Kofleriaceae bacterium]|jgi:phospholipase C|nr:alkaline phosphatase family protein [Kofleriaceae bacterium]
MINRRQAIKRIGGLAGLAAMPKMLSGCGDDGNDLPPGIHNYVYLMLENRTYDHMFGGRALEGLGGDGLTAGMANPDMNGTMIPIFQPTLNEMCVADPPHGWDPSHRQFNNGAMDGFVREYQASEPDAPARQVMQYLSREQIPVSWALADHYTTCDRWFASVMGPTLPNRAYWHAATSFGLKVNNEVLTSFSAVPVPTIYNRLHDKNVDWAYYSGPLAVASLLGNPGPYQLDLGPTDGTGNIRKFSQYPDQPEDPNGQFFKDCKNGTLPTVTYIDPFFGENDDHPPLHPIMAQALIAAVYNAIAQSRYWKHTMIVITYDEHGGFHDHVPPPKTTDDTEAKFGVAGFDQMGFRVPAMVIGPYAKQNYVSSTVYDHTSALKHLTNVFSLEPLNARVEAANDLMDCIDLDRLAADDPAEPIELPTIDLAQYAAVMGGPCKGMAFRTKDPITEWADANPGSVIDSRSDAATEAYHRGIMTALGEQQRNRQLVKSR